MTDEIRVTLIFDPYSIATEQGERVSSLAAELSAFAAINEALRRDPRFETIIPKVYVISGTSGEHFRTYQDVRGVDTKTITPRKIVGDLLRCTPPKWLTDEYIGQLHLLRHPAPEPATDQSWEATIASWLLPGIERAATLEQWLRIVSAAEDRFAGHYGPGPVSDWVRNQFLHLAVATETLAPHELAAALHEELVHAPSPVAFARKWVRTRAVLPLLTPSLSNPLRSLAVLPQAISAHDRQLASRLPLIFPLPPGIHEDVSTLFCNAFRKSRLNEKHRLSEAVRSLNAVWPGVAEELRTWLEIYPKGLDEAAAQQLICLPGYESNQLIRKLVDWYRPPNHISSWPGLQAGVESWLCNYAQYVRRCFLRRDFDETSDPATGFGRWLKDNATVSFEHHKYSYVRVAQTVHDALARERTVFLVMIDAFPIHQSEDLIGLLCDDLGAEPTLNSYVFVPIPTLTEVCKEAVLTGKPPSECRGDLKLQLQQRFHLSADEIHLSANWKDAERFQTNSQIRLIVHRDNRLDDHLHKLANYRAMIEDSKAIFLQLSRLLSRWCDDVRCITNKPPLVIVTGDHGFTFGPTPGRETKGHRALDGSHRCVAVEDAISPSEALDESITVLGKGTHRLKQNYVAARGRYFGRGTSSGWTMSHGGLLPEEVVVPFLEWFGDVEVTHWPAVRSSQSGYVESGNFYFSLAVENVGHSPTIPCSLNVSILGTAETKGETLLAMAVGSSKSIHFSLHIPITEDEASVPLTVTLRAQDRDTRHWKEQTNVLLIPRMKRLVEKTTDQDDFENMFS